MIERICKVCGDPYKTSGYCICEKCKRLRRQGMSEVEVCDRHIRAFPERAEWYTIQRDKHYAKQQEEIANGNFQHVHEAEIIEFRKQIKVSIRKNEYGRKVKKYRCHECGALLNRQTCKLCEGKIKGVYA